MAAAAPISTRVVRGSFALQAVALAVAVFYLATANLTRGPDFAIQWLGARMVASGQGRHLYDPAALAAAATIPSAAQPVADGIIPMYPPTQAVLYAPLGFVKPGWAQWAIVELSVLLAAGAAWRTARVGTGHLSWAAATLATLVLPSFFFTIALAQNSAVLLAMIATGWALLVEERALLAGLAWSLLAFKPNWLAAVLWIPAVLGRWAVYRGLVAGLAAFVLVTLPFCGLHTWLDWLDVARQTQRLDDVAVHWLMLRRDLPAVFRRLAPGTAGDLIGWTAIALMLAVTAVLWRRDRASTDLRTDTPRVVALLSAAALSCPRFMFYDATVGVLPFLITVGAWPVVGRVARLALVALWALFWLGGAAGALIWGIEGPPLETFALAGLWCWAVALAARHRLLLDLHLPAGSAGRLETAAGRR